MLRILDAKGNADGVVNLAALLERSRQTGFDYHITKTINAAGLQHILSETIRALVWRRGGTLSAKSDAFMRLESRRALLSPSHAT